MQIKTDVRVITGHHETIPFQFSNGVLNVNGLSFSWAEIKWLASVANCLELEGFKLRKTILGKELPQMPSSYDFMPGCPDFQEGQ